MEKLLNILRGKYCNKELIFRCLQGITETPILYQYPSNINKIENTQNYERLLLPLATE